MGIIQRRQLIAMLSSHRLTGMLYAITNSVGDLYVIISALLSLLQLLVLSSWPGFPKPVTPDRPGHPKVNIEPFGRRLLHVICTSN